MKYFAMIDGEQRGPFELHQLAEAGVFPDTYVWTKGMTDWQKAADDPEICRMFRQRLASLNHSGSISDDTPGSMQENVCENSIKEADSMTVPEDLSDVPPMFRRIVEKSGEEYQYSEQTRDYSLAPSPTLLTAIISAIICFPPTGIVAVYFSMMSRRLWKEYEGMDKSSDTDNAEETARRSHDACRSARMWTGISIFLGLIAYAFVVRFII